MRAAVDLRKLEIFCAVARQVSFSRAAEALHMAQPAVSIAVRKLEQELGSPLFERVGRQVRLTAEGKFLQQQAVELLSRAEDIAANFRRIERLETGELSIACPSMLATYFLPALLREFLVHYPGLSASITQAGTNRVRELLLQDEIEAGVITAHPDREDAELELLPLVRERVVVCVGRSHPWARRRYVDIGLLQSEPMVLYETGYFIREQFDALCRASRVAPDVRMQTNFLPLINSMITEGMGVGLGLRMMANQEPGIAGIPLHPAIELSLALAKRRGRRIAPANQAFLDWLAASAT
jgi:DNA-binding transcriptional LysR family regulator